MKENILSSAFKGFIELDQIKGDLEGFINYVKSDLNDELKMVRPAMLVVAQSEEQALLFAQGAISILREEHLSSYYVIRPSFLWNRPISDEYDCVLINDFDDKLTESNELERIKKRLTRTMECTRSDLVTIFCTTEARAQQYREFYKEDFYKLFQSRIHLAPYTIDNIKDGAHYCFDEWAERNEIQLEEGFYPQLNDWIKTVYGRADKKGKEFVEGLKERLIKQSKILGKPYVFGADTIPFYRPRDVLKDVEEEMNKDELLLWSQDFDAFLEEIRNKVSNNADKKSYNLVVSAKSESDAQKLAKFYARILNSKEYYVTSSKMMISVDISELQEIENFEKQNGVVFVKGFSSVKESDENELALKRLKTISESSMNDLVFVLYYETTVDEKKSTEDLLIQRLESFGLNTSFNFFLDLNKHNMESSLRLVSYKLKLQNEKMDNSKKNMLAQWVSNSSTLKDANNVIEKGIKKPNTITEEALYTDDMKIKLMHESESKLCKSQRNIKNNKKEKNILILPMSTMYYSGISEYEVKNLSGVSDDFKKGYYVSQLEPVPRVLTNMLNNKGSKLDAIYVLNTHETEFDKVNYQNEESFKKITDTKDIVDVSNSKYTAYSYFKERCAKFVDESNIHSVLLESSNNKIDNRTKSIDKDYDVERALYEITEKLQDELEVENVEKVHLYVDIHGGLRDSATVLNAIIMLMKDLDNIELEDIYAIDYTKPKGVVKSVKKIENIYDFVGGMHEFLSFGRSNGLKKYVEEENVKKDVMSNGQHEKNQTLVNTINMFSDGISLNKAGLFSESLSQLANKVNGVSYERNFGIVKQLISNNYVVYIDKLEKTNGEQSQYDLLGEEMNYLPAQLKWCLDKDLLQQALTLIESVMIESFINVGIVFYPKWGKDYAKNYAKDYKHAFDNWVNLSLFENDENQTRTMKCDGVEREMNAGQPMSYFKSHTEFFCDMDNGLAEQGKNKNEIENIILKRIHDYRNKSIDPKKYYLKCQYSAYKKCQYGINTGDKCFEKFDIPLVEILRNNRTYVDEFYELLFIHKGLKLYRNTVSHANAEKSNRLSKEDLRRWIELYIEVLDKLMRDAKVLLKK